MNTRQRGLIVFAVIMFVAIVFCGLVPFVVMPDAGFAVALPVIEVPGEIIVEDFLFGINLTNTIVGTVAADIILVIFVVWAWRASKGWTQKVPGRFQGLVERITEIMYNFFYGIAGDRLRSAPMIWPLVATIFIFLLAANWLKLLPGVETFGYMHCAYPNTSGYYMVDGWTDNSYRLWVDEPLNAGYSQDEAGEEACLTYKKGTFDKFTFESASDIEQNAAAFLLVLDDLPVEYAAEDGKMLEGDALHEAEDAYDVALEEYLAEESADPNVVSIVEDTDFRDAATYVIYSDERIAAINEFESLQAQFASIEAEIEGLQHDGDDEEAEVEGDVVEEDVDAIIEDLETELIDLEEAVGLARAQVYYPGATLPLSEEQVDDGAVPYIFHITPFVRGAATDLSLTFALAIMSIVLVQVYGVYALGPAYFDKFLNIPALGNLSKKPLGAIDFVVGLIEIISEVGKIISLAFRLFGNLFAGGVALMAVTFLVALLIPGVIYGLEIIIGTVQALVFAVLTLVFAVQAMEAHHGDDEHEHEHH